LRLVFAVPRQKEALIEGKYVVFHALALENLSQIAVMNPDDGFLTFYQARSTKPNQPTSSIEFRTIAAGLLISAGMLVAKLTSAGSLCMLLFELHAHYMRIPQDGHLTSARGHCGQTCWGAA